jgi:hypothetical protein
MTFGSALIICAIGLSELLQAGAICSQAARPIAISPVSPNISRLARWRRSPWSTPSLGESQSMLPSLWAT